MTIVKYAPISKKHVMDSTPQNIQDAFIVKTNVGAFMPTGVRANKAESPVYTVFIAELQAIQMEAPSANNTRLLHLTQMSMKRRRIKMSKNNEKVYINNAIHTYMTNKICLEFTDKMNPAAPINYANLHARGDDVREDGSKVRSNIGVFLRDFSNGKGDKSRYAEANIAPSQARLIFDFAKETMFQYLSREIFSSSKIFGNTDHEGRATMVIFRISREQADQSSGEVKKYPWTVEINSGTAVKITNSNGSAYAKGGTFQSKTRVTASLSDQDFYTAFAEIVAYIEVWEVTFGAKLLREGRILLDAAIAKHVEEQALNPKPPKQQYSAPPQSSQGQQGMTLEQARAVTVNFGRDSIRTNLRPKCLN